MKHAIFRPRRESNSGLGLAMGDQILSSCGMQIEEQGSPLWHYRRWRSDMEQTSAENTWKDKTEVTGGIRTLQKAFAYQSGFVL